MYYRGLIQYISDLHLNFNDADKICKSIIPNAKYLAICGDIGDPRKVYYHNFLHQVSKQFEKVFLVAGNHEMYHECIADTHRYLDSLCKRFSNIYYLNDSFKTIVNKDGSLFNIYGTIMWSNVHDTAFRNIMYIDSAKQKRANARDIRHLHKECLNKLENYLNTNDIDTILLTHFPIKKEMNGDFITQYSSYYTTDLPQLFRDPIKHVISGHVHTNVKKEFNGITCITNCVGYSHENILYDNSAIL